MEELRGHLVGDESIFTFTRGCADFRDPTAVFRVIRGSANRSQTLRAPYKFMRHASEPFGGAGT